MRPPTARRRELASTGSVQEAADWCLAPSMNGTMMAIMPIWLRRHLKWLVAVLAAAAVAAVGLRLLLVHRGRPTPPAGWTGLVGQLNVPFSAEPLSTVWIISSRGTVTEAHADPDGWFLIPLEAGDYDVTYQNSPACLRFYGAGSLPEGGTSVTPTPLAQEIAIHVAQGRAVTFDRTYTGCVQGY